MVGMWHFRAAQFRTMLVVAIEFWGLQPSRSQRTVFRPRLPRTSHQLVWDKEQGEVLEGLSTCGPLSPHPWTIY